MEFRIKQFKELNLLELYEALKLRNNIFIVEQNCPYPDADDKDHKAMHVLMMGGEALIGYARILPPGISYQEPCIGRVAVYKEHRGSGSGKLLMDRCITETLKLYKDQDIVISAQAYLIKFYTGLGFKTEGVEYLEDNIPHVKMRYKSN